MKWYKYFMLIIIAVSTSVFVYGCGGPDVDVAAMKGEEWVKLDKDAQQVAVEELIKTEGEKAKDHTSKYYVRQLNSYFGASGTSSKAVKDIFKELAVSGKTVEELTTVDGYAWKKMTREEKVKIIEAEVQDISSKNPAFKAKTTEIYLSELEAIYEKEEERFLKLPVSETIQKVLTNNLIINGELVK